jgi:hypothetical protein
LFHLLQLYVLVSSAKLLVLALNGTRLLRTGLDPKEPRAIPDGMILLSRFLNDATIDVVLKLQVKPNVTTKMMAGTHKFDGK